MSEVRSRMLEVGSKKSDVGSRKSEVGCWKSDVGSKKSDVERQMLEGGSQDKKRQDAEVGRIRYKRSFSIQ
jgi:hypothetical protein